MERHHYSSKPIDRLHAVNPWPSGDDFFKPAGFWYEVEGDWHRWCSENGQHRWVDNKHRYRLALGQENILTIRTAGEFDEFCRVYERPCASTFSAPAWRRLALDFDGIEIAPYLWERRLSHLWYYGWDCASGVIWTPRGMSLTIDPLDACKTAGAL